MLSESDLRGLLQYSAIEPVLSVYLNTDPSQGNADAYRLRLRTMLKTVNLPEDEAAIERYLSHEFDWTGRSVAIFSCAPDGFFKAFPLAIPVSDRLQVDHSPVVKPLADILDAYGGYGVVLVDKQGVRVFSFHLGELTEQEGQLGELVRHSKRGGASTFPGGRSGTAGRAPATDELIDRNMKEAVEFTTHFFEEKRVRRILIGGTDDNVAHFRSLLPKASQSLVVGTFPMSMTATHNEVLEKAMQIGDEAERTREKRMVENVVTAAAKGNAAVTRLDDTLSAIREGRVSTLLVNHGYREAGFRCQGCGFLTTIEMPRCPFCEGSFAQIPDAVELAIQEVMSSGGDVEVIHEEMALNQAGQIAALLRY